MDGNGQEARRSQRVWNTTNNEWEAWKSVYNIRSSLLNQTISKANFDGKKMRTLVIGGGSIIARQIVEDTGTEKVVFEFSDASGNSMRQVDLNGLGIGSSGSAELDPKGNNVGLTWLTGSSLRRERPDTGLDSKVADTQSMCTLGGLYGPCSIVEGLADGSTFGSNFPLLPFEMKGRTPRKANNPLIRNDTITNLITGGSGLFPRAFVHYQEGQFGTVNLNSNYLNYLVGNPTGGQQDSKPVPLPNNFAEKIKERINIGDCKEFIESLISKTEEILNRKNTKYITQGNTAITNNPLELVDIVSNQNGFVTEDSLTSSDGLPIGGTISGNILTNDAQVKLATQFYFNSKSKSRAKKKYLQESIRIYQGAYITKAIHELIHLAGKRRFSDYDLSLAAIELDEAKGNPIDSTDVGTILSNNEIWNNSLINHCGLSDE